MCTMISRKGSRKISYSQFTLFFFYFFAPLFFVHNTSGEVCPLFFGDSECPDKFDCILGICKDKEGKQPPDDCSQISCGLHTRCSGKGKCLPVEGMPCGRNVLVGENMAYSIVSDCGRLGKCVSGKCSVDRCLNTLCEEGEHCRDGKCRKLLGTFCFSTFDCGSDDSGLHCKSNKCEKRPDQALKQDFQLKCDPGELLQNGKCIPQDGCVQLVCELGETCLNGFCIPTTFECDNAPPAPGSLPVPPCPENMICRNRVCVKDPCIDRCPPEHACINGGECRLLQGLACSQECPPPFECINGLCIKDECRRKVCQIGERCDGGLCVRVQGRLCRHAERDCGEAFECEKGQCADKILMLAHKEKEEI